MLTLTDKIDIFNKLRAGLQQTHDLLVRSAEFAKKEAISPESKAENKYDTRGLEASYLAGAQAHRASELGYQIDLLGKIELVEKADMSKVSQLSLVSLLKNLDEKVYFMILPFQGGLIINYDKLEVRTLTVEAPLGKVIINKSVGDFFEINLAGVEAEFEIIGIT